jgi:MFS family permease
METDASDTAEERELPRSAFTMYGLAFFGVHCAFMPLVVLLLPRRVEALAGDAAPTYLSILLLGGAVIATASHVAAGAVSDRWLARHGSRRTPIIGGMVMLALAYVLLALAPNMLGLAMAFGAFQIALNAAFAPLGALLADYFPNQQKGWMGGLMNAALPASVGAISAIAYAFPQDNAAAFLLIGIVSLILMFPLIVRWPFAAIIEEKSDKSRTAIPAQEQALRRDFLMAWMARLLIQIGAAFVLNYLYLYLAGSPVASAFDADDNASDILAFLSWPAALLAIAATLLAGRASDAIEQRKRPLIGATMLFGLSLVTLAIYPAPFGFLIAYAVFHASLSSFLSIDTALVAQLVAGRQSRGTLLGVMNLTNTIPAFIVPLLALLAFSGQALQPVLGVIFVCCAFGALASAACITAIRTVD